MSSEIRTPVPQNGPFWLPTQPILRRITLALMDTLLLAGGLGLNFVLWLQFREGELPREYVSLFMHVVAPIVLLRVILFGVFGLYHSIARHAGNYELMLIAAADSMATAIIIVLNFAGTTIDSLGSFPLNHTGENLLRLPWGIVFSDWMLSLILIAGIRLLRREIAERWFQFRPEGTRRVLIVGAGDTGEQVARDLGHSTRGAFRPVAYIDPNPALTGHKIHGLLIAGTVDDLPRVIHEFNADEIVIALQRPTPRRVSEIIGHCHTARLAFRIVPPLDSVMSGGVSINTLRPVEIEDLLGRPPINLQGDSTPEYMNAKRVLVTGAGGSIGRELCRQALEQKPAALYMLGRGENSIFEALLELKPRAEELHIDLVPIIGDIRDRGLIDNLFDERQPQIVFHAAAHKHVHFMEADPSEAIKNNVLGTRVVAEAARRTGSERFIFISTDKAVRPTGVMGASKRIAETIVSAINTESEGAFVSVRFGNVLGSRGSVIPTFRRQIERGGPVTITHPEVTRYFMTIPEAVSLVIQAGDQGNGGELFLLDMGEPVRIADLARNLITLSGLEPDLDIEIIYTGLRPGEKLTEELLTEDEGVSATGTGKIFITRNQIREWPELSAMLKKLLQAAETRDNTLIREILRAEVPDYTPPE